MVEMDIESAVASPVVQALDLDMFDETDILNVVLQRSAVLYDVNRGGRLIRQWSQGNATPLADVVREKGKELILMNIGEELNLNE